MGALATTYKRENGKIYLNGTKTFITSSAGVKYLVIMAKNADDPTMFTEFFLDMSKPGVKLSPLTKLGLRMDSCCESTWTTWSLRRRTSSAKRATASCAACPTSTSSAGSWALRLRHRHLRLRGCYGAREQPHRLREAISRFQLNQIKITDMCIKLTNMKNMLYEPPGTPTTRRQLRPGRCRHVQVLLRQRLLRSDR